MEGDCVRKASDIGRGPRLHGGPGAGMRSFYSDNACAHVQELITKRRPRCRELCGEWWRAGRCVRVCTESVDGKAESPASTGAVRSPMRGDDLGKRPRLNGSLEWGAIGGVTT